MPIPKTTTIYGMPIEYEFSMTEDQRAMLTHCLHMAARRFEENAATIAEAPVAPGAQAGLAAQFKRQAEQALELANRIENASHIRIGKEEN